MKHAVLILGALICCAACKTSVYDNGCITLDPGPPTHSYLKPGQLDTIQQLFSANGLSTANLDFTYYSADTTIDSGVHWFYQSVEIAPTLNGLPVLFGNRYWVFRNGIFYPHNSYTSPFPTTNGDTTGHQTLPALRKLFFKAYETALYTLKTPDNHRHRPGYYYRDSCLYARLGYLDASLQPGNPAPINTQLLKVWEVTPQYHTPDGTPIPAGTVPIVFVVDSSGAAWCTYPYYPGEIFPPCPYCVMVQ